jgi:hypothetical protein
MNGIMRNGQNITYSRCNTMHKTSVDFEWGQGRGRGFGNILWFVLLCIQHSGILT